MASCENFPERGTGPKILLSAPTVFVCKNVSNLEWDDYLDEKNRTKWLRAVFKSRDQFARDSLLHCRRVMLYHVTQTLHTIRYDTYVPGTLRSYCNVLTSCFFIHAAWLVRSKEQINHVAFCTKTYLRGKRTATTNERRFEKGFAFPTKFCQKESVNSIHTFFNSIVYFVFYNNTFKSPK